MFRGFVDVDGLSMLVILIEVMGLARRTFSDTRDESFVVLDQACQLGERINAAPCLRRRWRAGEG
jgi:hypothetical protein